MSNVAFLFAPLVSIPRQLPSEPHRITPYEQAIDDWHEAGGDGEFPDEANHPDPFAHQPPRDAALDGPLHYRGATFRPVSRAEGLAFLAHSAKADAFPLGGFAGDELRKLRHIAHAYGGDCVALWTFAGAVHLWSARSPAPGAPPRVLELSVRLDAPADVGRPPGTADRIERWFVGSALAPDVAALRRELDAASVSVPGWFRAFGVPGARSPEPVDAVGVWDAFERAAEALLRGSAPDAAARRQVNAMINDADERLPAKPAAKRGATARRVANCFAALREALGDPTSPRLAACASAAALYDRITSGPAGDRLLQTSRKPLAVALALGRLLVHYPVAVRRDPIFLALAAREAEVWNGHAFVGPLCELAERADAPGFTAVVFPATLEARFHAAHGVRTEESAAVDGWAGEAAIDLGESGDLTAAFAHWLEAEGADGTVARCDARGDVRILRFAGGRQTSSAAADTTELSRAGSTLDPRVAVLALELPDVLAPGALAEEARSVGADGGGDDRRELLAARLASGEAVPVATLLDHPWPSGDRQVALLVRLATRDASYAASLERDLRQIQETGPHPAVARAGAELCVHASTTMPLLRPFARVLGDLPAGSRLVVADGEDMVLLEVEPAHAATGSTEPSRAADPDWVPPQVVLTAEERVYATADFSRLAWARNDGLLAARQLAGRYPDRVDATAPLTVAAAIALHDDELRAIGFERLGDLLATHLHGAALRAYRHRDGGTAALLLVAPMSQMVECEIQTVLVDGTEVTTSSIMRGGPPRPGASVRREPVGATALLGLHERHLAEVRDGRELRPAPATLADFARLLEPVG